MLNNFLNDLRSNPRLRLWLALIVGAIGLYGILTMRDALQQAKQQERAVALSITRLRAQLAQPEWLQRVEPANILAAQLEGRLWQAPTAGLAQAALQDWLNTTLAQTKAGKPQVTVTVLDEMTAGTEIAPAPTSLAAAGAAPDGPPPTPPDLWKIKAKIGFAYTAPSLLEFLHRVETHDKQIIVDTLSVRKEPLAHVEAELLAYFQKQTSPVKSAGAATPPIKP